METLKKIVHPNTHTTTSHHTAHEATDHPESLDSTHPKAHQHDYPGPSSAAAEPHHAARPAPPRRQATTSPSTNPHPTHSGQENNFPGTYQDPALASKENNFPGTNLDTARRGEGEGE